MAYVVTGSPGNFFLNGETLKIPINGHLFYYSLGSDEQESKSNGTLQLISHRCVSLTIPQWEELQGR